MITSLRVSLLFLFASWGYWLLATSACSPAAPIYTPTDRAELACIEHTDAGANAGRAATKRAIDDCRFAARADGGV